MDREATEAAEVEEKAPVGLVADMSTARDDETAGIDGTGVRSNAAAALWSPRDNAMHSAKRRAAGDVGSAVNASPAFSLAFTTSPWGPNKARRAGVNERGKREQQSRGSQRAAQTPTRTMAS